MIGLSEAQARAAICREQGHTLDDQLHCSVCGVTLVPGFTAEEKADLDRRIEAIRQRTRARAAAGEQPPPPLADTYGHRSEPPEGSSLPGWHGRRTFADLRAQWRDLDDTQAAALDYVERRASDYASYRRAKGLLLTGPVGAGKTSIAAAAAVHLHEPLGCKWRTADTWFAAIKASWDERTGSKAIEAVVAAKVLFLDGLFPTGRPVSPWEVARVQELIERRHNRAGALVLTTNLPAHTQHLPGGVVVHGLQDLLGESVWSRLVERVDIVPVVSDDHRLTAGGRR